jgi:hypothetical protein
MDECVVLLQNKTNQEREEVRRRERRKIGGRRRRRVHRWRRNWPGELAVPRTFGERFLCVEVESVREEKGGEGEAPGLYIGSLGFEEKLGFTPI